MADSTLRQRPSKGNAVPNVQPTPSTVKTEVSGHQSRGISLLDVVRVLLTVLATSCALSYYTTSGESVLWGYRPWFTRPALVKHFLKGSVQLTPAELALYNGTDVNLPIYLSINGTIFDVTAGRHTYGPGGSYHVFAGKDATRAFVTGCFKDDTTGDLRGAEEMYIPIEDPDEQISSGARKTRAEKERREAKKKVRAEVQKWEDFYRNHAKYFEVGKLVVVGEHAGEVRELCDLAKQGRPDRKKMNESKAKRKPGGDAPGKPVQ